LAIEPKVGNTSLTEDIQMQIAKDQLLVESGQASSLRWQFTTSGVTGRALPHFPMGVLYGRHEGCGFPASCDHGL
jgi:hypothetical protein